MAQNEIVLKIDSKDIMARMIEEMRVVFEAGWDAMRGSIKAEVKADYARREDLLEAAWLEFRASIFKPTEDSAEPKATYFIAWNKAKSEGYITNDKADAEGALIGKHPMTTLGAEFFYLYGEEEACPPVQEVELDLGRA